MSDSCYTYNFNRNDLIYPSMDIFYELCTSSDKTNLFIYSFLRIVILFSINEIIKMYLVDSEDDLSSTIILDIMFYYILVNIIYIGIVINKYPKYSKY